MNVSNEFANPMNHLYYEMRSWHNGANDYK